MAHLYGKLKDIGKGINKKSDQLIMSEDYVEIKLKNS